MIYLSFVVLMLLLSCSPTEPEESISGCTIQSACNFESDATTYDASCLWPVSGGCSCDDVENEVDGCNGYFSLDPANLIPEDQIGDQISDIVDENNFEFDDLSICSEVGYELEECLLISFQCNTNYFGIEWLDFDESDIEIDFPICCCQN